MRYLRDDPSCLFVSFIDLTAVDYPTRVPRFDVVTHLLSPKYNRRIRVKVGAEEDQPVASLISLYPSANWYEREVYDLFGVLFSGHPDLRRILTWEGFHGHPLRKDFPLEGVDTGAAIYPEEWPEGGGPSQKDPNRKVVS